VRGHSFRRPPRQGSGRLLRLGRRPRQRRFLHQDGPHPHGQGPGQTFKQQMPPPSASDGGSKRKRAGPGSFSGGENSFDSSCRHTSMDRQPVFSRGGYRGGARGGKLSFYGSRGGNSGYSGEKRFNKFGVRSSGGASGRRSGGSSGYKSRY
jgi:hypothetical protein